MLVKTPTLAGKFFFLLQGTEGFQRLYLCICFSSTEASIPSEELRIIFCDRHKLNYKQQITTGSASDVGENTNIGRKYDAVIIYISQERLVLRSHLVRGVPPERN